MTYAELYSSTCPVRKLLIHIGYLNTHPAEGRFDG